MLSLFILILFFTLSPSAYINFFFITIIIFFFTKEKKYKFISIIVIIPCFIYVFYKIKDILMLVLNRVGSQNFLQEYRVQAMIQPINYMFTQASLFNLLFGFGPKGIEYIGEESVKEIITDCHVVLIDWFVEYGVLGVLVLIFIFLYLYMLAEKTYFLTGNRLAQVLCVNLVITGLFRADYANPRYTIIFLLILFIYKDAKQHTSSSYLKYADRII